MSGKRGPSPVRPPHNFSFSDGQIEKNLGFTKEYSRAVLAEREGAAIRSDLERRLLRAIVLAEREGAAIRSDKQDTRACLAVLAEREGAAIRSTRM